MRLRIAYFMNIGKGQIRKEMELALQKISTQERVSKKSMDIYLRDKFVEKIGVERELLAMNERSSNIQARCEYTF